MSVVSRERAWLFWGGLRFSFPEGVLPHFDTKGGLYLVPESNLWNGEFAATIVTGTRNFSENCGGASTASK